MSTDANYAARPASAENAPPRECRAARSLELLVVFCIGVALMQYLYSATPDAARGLPAALPGNDDFYHLKMALLLPKIGLPDRLDWLQYTIFADRFVSHHYGFHVYLQPFVRLFSDPVIGARWAMSCSFGLVLAAAMLLLMLEGVGHRWLWLTLLLLLPDDFYVRHTYVRAIDLSLLCLLLGTMCLFRRRFLLLAAMLLLYTQVYLGSFFLIMIAGIHWLGQRLGARASRIPAHGPAPRGTDALRLPMVVALGAGVGLLTHPYSRGAIGFLRTQIFGSGLTPHVSVGREWSPYENVWEFAMRMGVPLTALCSAIALRFLRGARLRANEWTMLLTALFFFGLTLKAKRFVEYFPMFAVLAAAMLSAPLLGSRPPKRAALDAMGPRRFQPAREGRGRPEGGWMILAVKLVLGAWGGYACWNFMDDARGATWLTGTAAAALAYVMLVVEPASQRGAERAALATRLWRRTGSVVGSLALALALIGVLIHAGYPVQRRVRSWCEGNYDLREIQRVMEFVSAASNPGDIIFTDDWDIFPVFFYFNDKNRYVAGLDPMFSYERDPELWERYKLLTRGQAPLTATVKVPGMNEAGRPDMIEKKITVPLEDIRERYGARFVIVDSDHQPFARKLSAARGFVRQIYPPPGEVTKKPPPYSVYEVLPVGSNPSSNPPVEIEP